MIYSAIMRKARDIIKYANNVVVDMSPTYGQEKVVHNASGNLVKVIEINGEITSESCMVSNAVTVELKNGDKLVYIVKDGNAEINGG